MVIIIKLVYIKFCTVEACHPNLMSEGLEVDEGDHACFQVEDLLDRLSSVAEELGLPHNSDSITACVPSGSIIGSSILKNS